MRVKAVNKTMTEHSGQSDPAEALRRTLADHSHQIQSPGTTLQTVVEQQRHTNRQLEQLASLFQHVVNTRTFQAPEGVTANPVSTVSLVSQQLPHSRDVISPNPEKFSGEVSN
ncbi:hypothetical protein ATANTOWER_003486 [Ataeniobius toweri]|uniref:Uncharacterized protein n=1 Tax=Ataeniobius toweri TaxID=208326 RepID=A0ABU7BQI3_9TELE|nr:hypothetical protein [Ataeniobius toweri]